MAGYRKDSGSMINFKFDQSGRDFEIVIHQFGLLKLSYGLWSSWLEVYIFCTWLYRKA